ncbi:MAG TPA: Crp/Fnr family transcriptional regulator [Chryseosolibacter sp.]
MKGNCCTGECASLKQSVLSELSNQERCNLRGNAISLNLRRGQNIFEQGREPEGLFCIQQGKVRVALESHKGEKVTVGLYADRGTLGHESLFATTNAYTATCLSDATVCFLPKMLLKRSMSSYPSIYQRVHELVADETFQLNEVILSLRSKSVGQRLAEALIKLQNVFGKTSDGYIDAELTKEEIAYLVGSSVESIFRALSDFKTKKYLQLSERKIKILAETKLRSLGRIYS